MSKSGQVAYRAEYEPMNLTPEERAFVNQPPPVSKDTVRGFALTCPKCGHEGRIDLDLNSLNVCGCGECNGEFSPREALEEFGKKQRAWERAVDWIESAPYLID